MIFMLSMGDWRGFSRQLLVPFEDGQRCDFTMPTILMIMGWRFFVYANERNEPIHVHCQKGESEAK